MTPSNLAFHMPEPVWDLTLKVPSVPLRMVSICFLERSLSGLSSENPSLLATLRSNCMYQESSRSAKRCQGRMPPSLMDRSMSKRVLGSTSLIKPRPLQVGQAPCGELKEKVCGSISEKDLPVAGSTRRSEKKTSSFSSRSEEHT